MNGDKAHSLSFASTMRRLIFAGIASQALFAVSVARAEPPSPDLSENPSAPSSDGAGLSLSFSDTAASTPGRLNIAPARATAGEQGPRRFGFVLTANGGVGGAPLGLSVERHVTVDEADAPQTQRSGSGAEVRFGGAIADLRGEGGAGSGDSNWYVFAASDDEAVTWRPGARASDSDGASLSLQDRVEIGDLQAGVTLETNGVQASLAYVEREVSARMGSRTVTEDQSFTGITLTMRR